MKDFNRVEVYKDESSLHHGVARMNTDGWVVSAVTSMATTRGGVWTVVYRPVSMNDPIFRVDD